MSFSNIDLPNISFCEMGTEAIETAVLSLYEGLTETSLAKGDPVRLFLEALSAVIVQQRQIIDHTGKQNLLAYSEGDYLDHLGAFTSTARLDAVPATVTMRFNTAEIHGYKVAIDAGTQVSPDGQLWFETDRYAEIEEGDLYVDVPATCMTDGVVGNGYLAGQISTIAEPIDDISSCKNTTVSMGGAEVENDDAYRDRIHIRPESFSVAGPVGAYQYHVMSAHQNISDIAVFQTSPLDDLTTAQLNTVLTAAGISAGTMTADQKRTAIARWLSPSTVKVVPLLVGGEIPDDTMLGLVEADINNNEIRPLTDVVEVVAPTEEAYDIDCGYYIAKINASNITEIKARVEAALDEYKAWQCAKLGRDINPSYLIHLLMAAGASRVVVTEPAYTAVDSDAVASLGDSAMTYEGLDE